MDSRPIIVYVPGLKPKPESSLHKAQLARCLRDGLRRAGMAAAEDIDWDDDFRLVSWTSEFYGENRDIGLDLENIDTLLAQPGPSESDLRTATSLRRRFLIWLFRTADFLPFLIPRIATEEVQVHLRDFYRYVRNRGGISDAARRKLRTLLLEAHHAGRPVLLIAHSMGSVIAWDVLWAMTHEDRADATVDLFLTTGSPLGQNIVQRHLSGRRMSGRRRYPGNIRNWINVAAVGELTAIDRELADDFGEMVRLGLVAGIDDRDALTWYHMNGQLNVHVEYGYLVSDTIADVVGRWWSRQTKPDRDSV